MWILSHRYISNILQHIPICILYFSCAFTYSVYISTNREICINAAFGVTHYMNTFSSIVKSSINERNYLFLCSPSRHFPRRNMALGSLLTEINYTSFTQSYEPSSWSTPPPTLPFLLINLPCFSPAPCPEATSSNCLHCFHLHKK